MFLDDINRTSSLVLGGRNIYCHAPWWWFHAAVWLLLSAGDAKWLLMDMPIYKIGYPGWVLTVPSNVITVLRWHSVKIVLLVLAPTLCLANGRWFSVLDLHAVALSSPVPMLSHSAVPDVRCHHQQSLVIRIEAEHHRQTHQIFPTVHAYGYSIGNLHMEEIRLTFKLYSIDIPMRASGWVHQH